MESSLKSLISGSKSILILLPVDPVFDQVASATVLYLALSQEEGKEVNIYCPTPMIVEFNKLVAVNKVKSEIGNKNLSIAFDNYNPQGIEKVSWDIDKGQFKLTIVPKANVVPPTQDQVVVSYTGVAADTIILVGGGSESDFPALSTDDLKDAQIIHLGINQLSTSKALSSLATASSSVSQVVADLIKKAGYSINEDMATNLLMGIEEGTKEFSTPGVTADTFAWIAELMRAGGKRENEVKTVSGAFQPMSAPAFPEKVPSSWTEPKIFKGTSTS